MFILLSYTLHLYTITLILFILFAEFYIPLRYCSLFNCLYTFKTKSHTNHEGLAGFYFKIISRIPRIGLTVF